jgi:surface polysaccharide O-acyltransferase-like enzyme
MLKLVYCSEIIQIKSDYRRIFLKLLVIEKLFCLIKTVIQKKQNAELHSKAYFYIQRVAKLK